MQSIKKSGRILGLLFLASVITGGAGTALRGLAGAESNTTAFLSSVVESMSQMKLAINLDMLGSAIGVIIGIFLLPIIRKHSLRMASAYIAIACINFTIITVSNIIHVALLSVSAGFDLTSVSDTLHFTTLAQMLYDTYYWTHFLMLLLYSIGGAILLYFLFKTQLVPRWLAIWGLLASAIVFLGGALQLAEIKVSFLLFAQNGIFMLTFIGWLLVMGFRPMDFKELK